MVFSCVLQVVLDDLGLFYGCGLVYVQFGKVDQVVIDLCCLFEFKFIDIDVSNVLGYILVDVNCDLFEVECLIVQVCKVKLDDLVIVDFWGWLQYWLGYLDQVVSVLCQVWVQCCDVDVGVYLGEVLWKSGQCDEVMCVFDQVCKIDLINVSLCDMFKWLQL